MIHKTSDMAGSNYEIRHRLWISGKRGTFIGSGRVSLLRAIEQHGSITKAANSMNMSYRKAWEQINAMNIEAEKPLVIRQSGGVGGGGTIVTPEGKRMIENFNTLNNKCSAFLEQEAKSMGLT